MLTTKKSKKLAQVSQQECVACGTCLPVCPRTAIEVVGGVYAEVTPERCVGCRKCVHACPASIITMSEVTS